MVARHLRVGFGIGLGVVGIVWLALGQTEAASFRGLGSAGGDGFSSCSALAVSADGTVVAGDLRNLQGDWEAFRWTAAEGIQGLGDLPGGAYASGARAVSADGLVVVGASSSSSTGLPFREAFRWTKSAGMLSLNSPMGSDGAATDVSADGSVVVGAIATVPLSNYRLFRWTESGGMSDLGPVSTGPYVSANGSTIVASDPSLGAFRWTEATGRTYLGGLPSSVIGSPSIYGISSDASVVVGAVRMFATEDAYWQAFRWSATDGDATLFGPPQDFNTWAYAATADGSVIVGSGQSGAFLRDAVHGQRSLRDVLVSEYGLDLEGWQLDAAYGISSDGTVIVGTGYNPSGQIEGWVATVPEPSTIAMVVTGMIALLVCARGRRVAVPRT